MNLLHHNRQAWNLESAAGGIWSTPVDAQTIARARAGSWQVILTPKRAVPREWFGVLRGKRLLCLASGGGQQAPILAAAGAQVLSFDLSDEQLAKDRLVAEREGWSCTACRATWPNSRAWPTPASISSSIRSRICSCRTWRRSDANATACCAPAARCWRAS